MTVVLTQNAYGKSSVRLTKVTRLPEGHELAQWTVDIQLTGEFAAAYIAGDNRGIVATDTMKNIIYALAREHDLTAPESFGMALSDHFLTHYSQVDGCRIRILVEPYQRITVESRPHPHAFTSGAGGHRTCLVAGSRTATTVAAGIEAIALLKTTDSAFRGFHRDSFTTLPEADDRILATLLDTTWQYMSGVRDWNQLHAQVRQTLLQAFAEHKSLSVQQTLFAMGTAVLEAAPQVEEISLTMPNPHHILINLEPFGRDNPNCIFVPTSEPYGLISGTLRRE
jgi:urate oxidase